MKEKKGRKSGKRGKGRRGGGEEVHAYLGRRRNTVAMALVATMAAVSRSNGSGNGSSNSEVGC